MTNNNNRISIRPIVYGLESAFDALNTRFFDGLLKAPCITVSEGTTMRAYGWYVGAEVWHDGEKHAAELNVSCDSLNIPSIEVLTTLMHEMVHIECERLGIKDTARNGIRHNKKFAETAEAHGMIHEKRPDFEKVGFAGVRIPEALHDEILTLCDEFVKAHTIYRDAPVKGEKKKAKQGVIKYICPVCGCSCRATKPINIMCMECDETMLQA